MAAEVYRDRWLLVVDKPAGQPTQRTRAGEDGLYEALCAEHPYVGLHHRLDRNASGLVLFTLDRSVNKAVTTALKKHAIGRQYRARVEGAAQSGTWSWEVDGKPARTEVTVLHQGAGITEIRCRLHTGRRHQIRVHAAMNGTPILGDIRYGGDLVRRDTRLALHAERLMWTHPKTGAPLDLESAPPWT